MWQVVEQSRAVSLLQRSLGTDSVAHAYLFVGPAHVGKMTLALNLAQALNCEAAEPPCGECVSCQKVASAKHADVQIIGLSHDGDSNETKPRQKSALTRLDKSSTQPACHPLKAGIRYSLLMGLSYCPSKRLIACSRLWRSLQKR